MRFAQLLLRWLPTFLMFPLGGLIATMALGPISDLLAAAVSGAIVGVLVGLAQWLALRPIGVSFDWVWVTAVSLMVASPLAWTVISYNTTISNLTIWGLITGLIVGFSQATSQRKPHRVKLAWSALVSIAWGGAWLISGNVIVDADSNYAIFGSTGALTATLFLSLLINRLLAKQERS